VVARVGERRGQEGLRLGAPREALLPHARRRQVQGRSQPRRCPRLLLEVPPGQGAYQWELRLQDEIRPDFTLDEVGSDAARAAFEADHADEVEALVAKEHLRRQRKLSKAGEASTQDEPQGELELDGDGDTEDVRS